MHLPKGENALRHSFDLVKPGGWLIVEEPDDEGMENGGEVLPPGFHTFVSSWLAIIRARGAEPCIGRELGGIIGRSGYFSEVNIRKAVIPYSVQSADEKENKLGQAWRALSKRNAEDFPRRFSAQGITPEASQLMLKELDDPSHSLTTDLYFTYSKRKTY